MIRMLGAVCLAAGPVWLGMSAAAELAHRERALGALCAGLELMERELALRLVARWPGVVLWPVEELPDYIERG